jgi:hypothetical protein
MKDEITVEQIYQDVVQSSLSQSVTDSQFIQVLQRLCVDLGQRLEGLSEQEFAKAWFLHSIAQELLKYSIEDDLVDVSRIRRSAISALLDLIRSENGLSNSVKTSLNLCRELAKEKPIKTQAVLVEAADWGESIQVKGKIPSKDAPSIQVSSQSFDFVALLEDSLADPRFARGI